MNSADLARREAGENLPIEELVARLQPALVPVPAQGDRVCGRCRSDKLSGEPVCTPCQRNQSRLHGFALDVLPISMSEHMGRLHDNLRQYKDATDACVRYRMSTELGGLLVHFLKHHAGCLGDFDKVVTVPSKKQRLGGHPLHELASRIQGLRDKLVDPIIANPSWNGGQREADPHRFLVVRKDDVEGERVLLLEDTFTSGASIQSAAYAIHHAGASSITALVIGRHVNPGNWPPGKDLLGKLSGKEWDATKCGICGPVVVSPSTLL